MTVLILALVLIAIPVGVEWSRTRVATKRKAGVPGELVDLPTGKTHVLIEGPEDGPAAVLVHGLTTPAYVYAGIAPQLVRAGFRVIRYDLYGRGLSDKPVGRQDARFFVDQLNAVLDHARVATPYLLVGYSMGGAIVATKAAEEPEDIDGLVLIAPTGFRRANMPRLAEVPVIGDWVMWVFGGILLRRRMAGPPDTASVIPDMAAREGEETRTRGYLPSVLSSIRNLVQQDLSDEHRAIVSSGLPV
ncbi:MAG: alpha/beta fold hydrolase, partial [Pseudomonadota bacterium]